MPRLPRIIAASIPAGPAPTTSTSLSAFFAGSNFSGCQPRRYSSPARRVLRADERRAADLPARDADVAADALADVVEPALVDLLSAGTGSAIDGRQVAMMSSAPELIASTIRSGFVQRPTPSTGFVVTSLIRFCHGIARPDG